VAGGGGVDQDEVRHPVELERLHLPEHQHVADTGDGRCHHVDHPGADETLRDTLEAMGGEVLEERVIGRDASRPHTAAHVGELDLRVFERFGRAEGMLDTRAALQLDDEDREPDRGRHCGEPGGHGGLADSAFAGDHQDPALSAEAGDVHPSGSVAPGTAASAPGGPKLQVTAPCSLNGGGARLALSGGDVTERGVTVATAS
jgi:hypothetical protein